jgi:hypothetical protein
MRRQMVKIERVTPRMGGVETPWLGERGYQLADPALPAAARKLVKYATFAETLEEVARLVAKGYALRMGAPGKRPSLISPKSLRITP